MNAKRITGLVLAVCLCMALGATSVLAAPAQSYSLVDIVTMAKAMGGQITLTEAQRAAYDVNGDGALTIADLVIIAESLLASSAATAPTVQAPVQAQPTVCPTCSHYPCICSQQNVNTSRICSTCGQYPCICGSRPSTGVTTPSWTCGTCHRNPCVCSNSSGGWHHGGGHHGGWHH